MYTLNHLSRTWLDQAGTDHEDRDDGLLKLEFANRTLLDLTRTGPGWCAIKIQLTKVAGSKLQ